jgi:hypothetical protein
MVDAKNQESSGDEELLLGHLRRIESDRTGIYAVHLHLSELQPGNRQPHFIGIAKRVFEGLVGGNDALLFVMSNCDLILVCREVPIEEIDAVIAKTRSLFSEDPLTLAEDGSFDDRFTTWYDLSQETDLSAFMKESERLVKEDEEKREKLKEAAAEGVGEVMMGIPLDPKNLSQIEKKMRELQTSKLIKKQSAVVVYPNSKGEKLFQEHTISIFDLQEELAPNVNLYSSVWLFRYLTGILDAKILSALTNVVNDSLEEPISINLNISSLQSKEFQNFHRSVGSNAEKVIIELQMVEIFLDMGAYEYARDFLRGNGYRVLIDGLNPLSLQFFDPSHLKADFVKVSWGKEFKGEFGDVRMAEMRDMVKKVGRDKVILARIDAEDIVKWGLALGISRFQGHYMDVIVDAMLAKGII